jgi:endonuclease-3 related protein
MCSHTLAGQRLMEIFELLSNHFGPQNWWPAETELEMIVGAVLTQNTNWKNVEKAIENLKGKGLLSLEGLRSLAVTELAQEIRPAGYFNIKAKRLMNLIDFLSLRTTRQISLCSWKMRLKTLDKAFFLSKGLARRPLTVSCFTRHIVPYSSLIPILRLRSRRPMMNCRNCLWTI